LSVYAETVEVAVNEDETGASLPDVKAGDAVKLLETKPEQHFTQPPPRFSEATLVKELEEKGIGRPSTYAAILSTIQDRKYVEKKEARLYPTELGVMVNGLLVKSFPDIVSTDFTAQMEEQLDQVEEGEANWVKLLDGFYKPFKIDLEKAKVEMRNLKAEEKPTDEVCEKCGKPMVFRSELGQAARRFLQAVQDRSREGQGRDAQLEGRGEADRRGLREVRQADGD